MRIDILTLFPDTMHAVLHESILGRAAAKGILEINCVQIRDFTDNKQCQVDDYPYGGGWGCVMMAQPLKACLDSVLPASPRDRTRVIYLSPQGAPFNEVAARRLQHDYDHLVLVCGHYEGVDERFIEKCVDEEISIGDFVLTGGEIAAMAVTDAVCRLVPGVLADEACYTDESLWAGLLEYPQYTRPDVWEGMEVPEVLREGNHAKIDHWRKKQQLLRTKAKRPDLYEKLSLSSPEDQKLLAEIERDSRRLPLTQKLSCVEARREDLGTILSIISDARAVLKARHVDQWQGTAPSEADFLPALENHGCFLIRHGDEIAGVFCLSACVNPAYEALTDGRWSSDGPCAVLKWVALRAKYRGSGISAYLLQCAEDAALHLGVHAIRTDIHKKNRAMRQLLTAGGYTFRGNVLIPAESGHDPRRQAFEKQL